MRSDGTSFQSDADGNGKDDGSQNERAEDRITLYCLKNTAKHILYTVVNSNAMNIEIVGYEPPVW